MVFSVRSDRHVRTRDSPRILVGFTLGFISSQRCCEGKHRVCERRSILYIYFFFYTILFVCHTRRIVQYVRTRRAGLGLVREMSSLRSACNRSAGERGTRRRRHVKSRARLPTTRRGRNQSDRPGRLGRVFFLIIYYLYEDEKNNNNDTSSASRRLRPPPPPAVSEN